MGKVGIFVWRTSVQRGALGGSRPWRTVFAAMAAVKIMKRISGNVPETVFSAELGPGESLIINHLSETYE